MGREARVKSTLSGDKRGIKSEKDMAKDLWLSNMPRMGLCVEIARCWILLNQNGIEPREMEPEIGEPLGLNEVIEPNSGEVANEGSPVGEGQGN